MNSTIIHKQLNMLFSNSVNIFDMNSLPEDFLNIIVHRSWIKDIDDDERIIQITVAVFFPLLNDMEKAIVLRAVFLRRAILLGETTVMSDLSAVDQAKHLDVLNEAKNDLKALLPSLATISGHPFMSAAQMNFIQDYLIDGKCD